MGLTINEATASCCGKPAGKCQCAREEEAKEMTTPSLNYQDLADLPLTLNSRVTIEESIVQDEDEELLPIPPTLNFGKDVLKPSKRSNPVSSTPSNRGASDEDAKAMLPPSMQFGPETLRPGG